jgi:hypothetical protein
MSLPQPTLLGQPEQIKGGNKVFKFQKKKD